MLQSVSCGKWKQEPKLPADNRSIDFDDVLRKVLAEGSPDFLRSALGMLAARIMELEVTGRYFSQESMSTLYTPAQAAGELTLETLAEPA